jgi:hypothetical protein
LSIHRSSESSVETQLEPHEEVGTDVVAWVELVGAAAGDGAGVDEEVVTDVGALVGVATGAADGLGVTVTRGGRDGWGRSGRG